MCDMRILFCVFNVRMYLSRLKLICKEENAIRSYEQPFSTKIHWDTGFEVKPGA